MRWRLYTGLFVATYLLLLPRFLLRMARRGGYRKGFSQRFGRIPAAIRRTASEGGWVWIQAVSVGEAHVAVAFAEALRARRPQWRFVYTTNTSTAHALLERRLGPRDALLYNPLDIPSAVNRFLDVFQPLALILTEMELWPNLIRLTHDRGIPVALVNGRLSVRSARGYGRLPWLFGPVMRRLDAAFMQADDDARRLVALGATPEHVKVLPSAKYDAAPVNTANDDLRTWLTSCGAGPETLRWVAGSTWPGEEALLLDLYRHLRKRFPTLRLILVPRHAERRQAVREAVERAGFACRLRTLDGAQTEMQPPDTPVVPVLDTTGELVAAYGCADVVFVGKSLTQVGGQNPIEPAALGRAIVVGPHMENFQTVMSDFLAAGAVLQVADGTELAGAVERLVADATLRQEMGQRARHVVDAARGAVARTTEHLLTLIASRQRNLTD